MSVLDATYSTCILRHSVSKNQATKSKNKPRIVGGQADSCNFPTPSTEENCVE